MPRTAPVEEPNLALLLQVLSPLPLWLFPKLPEPLPQLAVHAPVPPFQLR